MQQHVHIRPVERLPKAVRVADFDELKEETKDAFYAAIADGSRHTRAEAGAARQLAQYDVIKFTGYYEVVSA